MELPLAKVHLPYVTLENEAALNREYGRGQFMASVQTEEWYVQQSDRLLGYEGPENIYDFTGRTQLDLTKIAVKGLLHGIRAAHRLPDERFAPVLLLDHAALDISDTQTFGFKRWPIVGSNRLVAVSLDAINGEVRLQPTNLK